jgi:Zn-dependent protease
MNQLTPEFLAMGAIWYIVFLFSTTCHEAAHALAAKLGGDPTAFHGGQVSLSPFPHIRQEPFGMVVVPLLSFAFAGWMMGWASAPYDPMWQQRYPRRAAVMSLAGPAANFCLMLLAVVGLRVGAALGWFPAPAWEKFFGMAGRADAGLGEFAATLLSVMFLLNLLLGTFNLLPVPPLDGSSGITLLMPERTALRYLDFIQEPTFSFVGIVVAWWLFNKFFAYVFALAFLIFFSA